MPPTHLSIADLIGDHRPQILALAARRGASDVRVFGSVARADAHPASDIDFLMTFAPTCTLIDYVGLIQDLEALLGRKVDIVRDTEPPTPFVASIRADAVAL